MATKKAASTAKKSTARKTAAKTTKTTKKTVSAAPAKATNVAGHVRSSLQSTALWRALGAEFIGALLLAGVVIAGQGQPIFVLFALVAIVLIIGGISGAHVNPAVTIGAWVTRRIGWLRALGYIIAQVLGAAMAFVIMSAFIGGAAQPSAEAQLYGQAAPALFSATELAAVAGKEWFVFFAELFGVAILGFGMAYVTRAKDSVAAAFGAGTSIFVALMFAVSAAGFVGASGIINPAVAVALQAFDWNNLWTFGVYALAPAIGGIVGFIAYDAIRGKTN